MQNLKQIDLSKVHVYVAEFIHVNGYREFHRLFGTSIEDARKRAYILKKHLFRGYIPLCNIRTVVFRDSLY